MRNHIARALIIFCVPNLFMADDVSAMCLKATFIGKTDFRSKDMGSNKWNTSSKVEEKGIQPFCLENNNISTDIPGLSTSLNGRPVQLMINRDGQPQKYTLQGTLRGNMLTYSLSIEQRVMANGHQTDDFMRIDNYSKIRLTDSSCDLISASFKATRIFKMAGSYIAVNTRSTKPISCSTR